MKLLDILKKEKQLEPIILGNTRYYRLVELQNVLMDFRQVLIHTEFIIDDLIISPYYIDKTEGIYNDYSFELSIKVSNEPDQFSLRKMYLDSISGDINESHNSRANNLIHCIKNNDRKEFIEIILNYFDYLLKNKEFINGVNESVGEYYEDRLYLSFY